MGIAFDLCAPIVSNASLFLMIARGARERLDFVVLTVLRMRRPPDQMHFLAALWAYRSIICAEAAGRHASLSRPAAVA
jgi:hypothetical protein